MKNYVIWQLVKPLLTEPKSSVWYILGTEADFRNRFKVVYGEQSSAMLEELFANGKFVGGNGTWTIRLYIFEDGGK